MSKKINEVLVSIIIPVYNTKESLHRCINSILSQTHREFELILVDDGSTDNSGFICDEFARIDKRITVIHKINGGVSSARNAGIHKSKGEFLTFIDSDDYIDVNFLEESIESIKEHPSDLYISGLIMESTVANKLQKKIYTNSSSSIYTPKELFESLEVTYPLICISSPCCKLYRHSIIKDNCILFDETLSLGEDTYFNLLFLEHTHSIFFSEKYFYHYTRSNANSLFSKFNIDSYEIHTKVFDRMRQSIAVARCSISTKLRFESLYFSLLTGTIHLFFRHFHATKRQDKIYLIKKVANNNHIIKMNLHQINGYKNKILLILLKTKSFSLIYLFFYLWYYPNYDKKKKKHK